MFFSYEQLKLCGLKHGKIPNWYVLSEFHEKCGKFQFSKVSLFTEQLYKNNFNKINTKSMYNIIQLHLLQM